jgi:hypothetical protein
VSGAKQARRGLDESFRSPRKGLDDSAYNSNSNASGEENEENDAALVNMENEIDKMIARRLSKEMLALPPKPPGGNQFRSFNVGQMDGRRRGPGYDAEGLPPNDTLKQIIDMKQMIQGMQVVPKEQQRYSTPSNQAPVLSRDYSPVLHGEPSREAAPTPPRALPKRARYYGVSSRDI